MLTLSDFLSDFLQSGPNKTVVAHGNQGEIVVAKSDHKSDISRIKALPSRQLDVGDPAAAEKWTKRLQRLDSPPTSCACKQHWGFCIHKLNPIQGWGLEEASKAGGLLGLIGVGHGKTGLDILLAMAVEGVKTAVLFVPPALRTQFLVRDFPQWSAHFRVPNLAGGRYFVPGLPTLHLVAYSELSGAKATDLLTRLRPDMIIADEAHCLKRTEAARTKRFLRYLRETPQPVKFCAMSGTLTNRSLKDYAHLSQFALREGSPLPLHWSALEEWSTVLDAGSAPWQSEGEVARLRTSPDQTLRQAFRERLISTPGVVATKESALGTSLTIGERRVKVPPAVEKALEQVRSLWQRPDGEELVEALELDRVLRQVSCGFFYRWTWPRGESREVVERWLAARKEWHKEVREKLKHSREHLDSPLLLSVAAERWRVGFKDNGTPIPPHTKHPLTWPAIYWDEWRCVRDSCAPDTEAVWIDDFLARDAAEWASESPGIVWYTHQAFGERVASLAGVPFFGPGEEAAVQIMAEKGDRSIVASIQAHGTGKNLQHAFHRNLIANSLSSGSRIEQLLGRTHRQGQPADEVTAEFFTHTPEVQGALKRAVNDARYQQESTGDQKRLCYANWTFTLEGDANGRHF